jgi:Ca2+-binding EF-hand superfamily protein
VTQLTPEQIAEIRENFEHFDHDSNGRIDFFEFTRLLSALGAGMEAGELRAGFAHLDRDANGEIDFNEFMDWWGERYQR